MKPLINTILATALTTIYSLAHAEVAVIVNAAANATPSQPEVANIFLGKNNSLKAIDQKGWSPTKEKFYSALTKKVNRSSSPTGPGSYSRARASHCKVSTMTPP